ncbi:hypothetical protein [Oceanobacillus sp. FSL H7-0719]|uniref:hypothetical protein n=1 Tax=Oceanobacillus sp. FSL H7-0719 TaxID=2954507 RepID=UPI00324AE541
MKTTREYFNMTIDKLLETDMNNETREERLLIGEGLNCTMFDSEENHQEEKEQFESWLHDKDMKVKIKLKTVNERIALISE